MRRDSRKRRSKSGTRRCRRTQRGAGLFGDSPRTLRLRDLARCADPVAVRREMEELLLAKAKAHFRGYLWGSWDPLRYRAWAQLAVQVCAAQAAGTLQTVHDIRAAHPKEMEEGAWEDASLEYMLRVCKA